MGGNCIVGTSIYHPSFSHSRYSVAVYLFSFLIHGLNNALRLRKSYADFGLNTLQWSWNSIGTIWGYHSRDKCETVAHTPSLSNTRVRIFFVWTSLSREVMCCCVLWYLWNNREALATKLSFVTVLRSTDGIQIKIIFSKIFQLLFRNLTVMSNLVTFSM